MLSQDVLHSYYVPDSTKKDVLPNRYTMQWFETTGITDNKTAIMKDNSYTDFAPIDAEEQRKTLGVPQLGETGAKDVVEMVASQCAKEKELDPKTECQTDPSQITAGVHQVFAPNIVEPSLSYAQQGCRA